MSIILLQIIHLSNNEIIQNLWLNLTEKNLQTDCSYGYGTFDELVKEEGSIDYYSYEVLTDDNFVLRMFRIFPKNTDIKNYKPLKGVVLLIHGLQDSADSWMVNEYDNNLPLRLLDEGFDVWFGNFRGNKYSNSHIFKQKDNHDFYSYGIDEISKYDFPALVNFPLETTKNKHLVLICHSQSTSFYTVAFSEKRSYAKMKGKISKVVMLNPTLDLSEIPSYWVNWLGYLPQRIVQTKLFTIINIADHYLFAWQNFPGICQSKYKVTQKLHKWFIYNMSFFYERLFIFTDISQDSEDYNMVKKFMMHFPAGTSWKNLVHLTQQMRGEGDIIKRYDYGPSRNHSVYGTKEAKHYELSNIKDVKISAYIGTKDFLEPLNAAKKGFARLTNNQENIKLTPVYGTGHSSFLTGKNSKTTIDKIIKDCNEF